MTAGSNGKSMLYVYRNLSISFRLLNLLAYIYSKFSHLVLFISVVSTVISSLTFMILSLLIFFLCQSTWSFLNFVYLLKTLSFIDLFYYLLSLFIYSFSDNSYLLSSSNFRLFILHFLVPLVVKLCYSFENFLLLLT